MKRILITGMSGTGKSTLIRELAARGHKAIDTDSDHWCEWVMAPRDPDRPEAGEEPDWVWREDRIQHLLSTEDTDVLFVSGCKSNQGKFYPQFDHVILLSAPVRVLLERLATRVTNPYGKDQAELVQILAYVETVEPLLRRTASAEVDTSGPLEEVVETVLRLVLGRVRPGSDPADYPEHIRIADRDEPAAGVNHVTNGCAGEDRPRNAPPGETVPGHPYGG